MFKADSQEAQPIVDATLAALLAWAPTRGRDGANLRQSVNHLRANALTLLQADAIGQPLSDAFDLALTTGINLQQIERVRLVTDSFDNVQFVGAQMIKDSLIQLALVTQARLIVGMTFVSRTDVDIVRNMINASFSKESESMANQMDAMTYRAVIALHAAVSFFLVQTARPLPQMLNYRFSLPMTTLGIAQRLYADATRADEILAENHIRHPAFAPRIGRALSE
jgi:prophage DNA circulation protein